MPLLKTIKHSLETEIFVWKITEKLTDLKTTIQLKPESAARLQGMQSEVHQKAFLCVRKLLETAGYTDFDLWYDASGKPHLSDGKYISISHSHDLACIIISHQKVGIDVEMQRDKILKIANKYIDFSKMDFTENKPENITVLTHIWGAKEAIFKIQNQKGISFKDHIQVAPFQKQDLKTKAVLEFENKKTTFDIYCQEIENFCLVYTLISETNQNNSPYI